MQMGGKVILGFRIIKTRFEKNPGSFPLKVKSIPPRKRALILKLDRTPSLAVFIEMF